MKSKETVKWDQFRLLSILRDHNANADDQWNRQLVSRLDLVVKWLTKQNEGLTKIVHIDRT